MPLGMSRRIMMVSAYTWFYLAQSIRVQLYWLYWPGRHSIASTFPTMLARSSVDSMPSELHYRDSSWYWVDIVKAMSGTLVDRESISWMICQGHWLIGSRWCIVNDITDTSVGIDSISWMTWQSSSLNWIDIVNDMSETLLDIEFVDKWANTYLDQCLLLTSGAKCLAAKLSAAKRLSIETGHIVLREILQKRNLVDNIESR